MLEEYFVKPETIDRIRGSWMGPQIESYGTWLVEQGYAAKTIWRRVPIAAAFGEFARERGAHAVAELPAHVEAFVTDRVERHNARSGSARPMAKEVRGPVEQFLSVVLPAFKPSGRPHHAQPFADVVPGFFGYLVEERGLSPASVRGYRHHLDRFEAYLRRIGVERLEGVSPTILSSFVVERAGAGLAKTTIRDGAGVLRVFLRYAHREGLLPSDLGSTVEWPQAYRLSGIPRSISWDDVNRVLGSVDRRTACGRRDYAILLLLAASMACAAARSPRSPLRTLTGNAGGSLSRNARPGTRPRSRSPRWSARPFWPICSRGGPRRPTATCSSGRRRRAGRSGPQRCHPGPATTC